MKGFKTKLLATLAMFSIVNCQAAGDAYVTAGFGKNPYQYQIDKEVRRIRSRNSNERIRGLEALGFLRAYSAANKIVPLLKDTSADVRREAVMALSWCGIRSHLLPLAEKLDDSEWTVRQAAGNALQNMTGMSFPFDSMASETKREQQKKVWLDWIQKLEKNKAPADVLALVKDKFNPNLAYKKKVTASSTYKTTGSDPKRLTDGEREQLCWLPEAGYPAKVAIDLKKSQSFSSVIIYQSEIDKCMTDFALEVSSDGESFTEILREKNSGEKELWVDFKPVEARYLRLVSYDSLDPEFPAAIYEVEVFEKRQQNYQIEKGLRALGYLGGEEATNAVLATLKPYIDRGKDWTALPSEKTIVQAGIRSLGKLKQKSGYDALVRFLQLPQWAHYAAEALADFGDKAAVAELLKVFPDYTISLTRGEPKKTSAWDRPGLSPIDRMYMAPYAIAKALSRLPLNKSARTQLKVLTPWLVANLPGDYDGAVIYKPQAWQLVFSYLLEKAETRKMVVDVLLDRFGVEKELPDNEMVENLKMLVGKEHQKVKGHYSPAPIASAWIPAFCRGKKECKEFAKLLEHEDGWVRMNVAKALMFNQYKPAAFQLHKILAESKREADYGYYGGFLVFTQPADGQSEYNDPGPRWREAYIMALGYLKCHKATPLLAKIMYDRKNAPEIQYMAAKALGLLENEKALKALSWADKKHPLHSVRLMAKETLWRNGKTQKLSHGEPVKPFDDLSIKSSGKEKRLRGIVFIQGEKHTPNSYQMDNWRQLYGTTDSGPTYRHGDNVFVLLPSFEKGKVKQLTFFEEGYVADCEVSWDAKKVLFSHRGGEKDPWWHIYEVNVDGTGLKQLTSGPYHDVQPNYLSDGRIVFSSSRMGLRDEYHGYMATGLTIMNPDGSDIHSISSNLGRDAEPVLLQDGRIAFNRLELFYARMKTEWNVEAVYPDGTRNTVLYGPEKRQFWYRTTKDEGIGWTVSGLRHRTLRVSQVQPYKKEQMLAITQKGLTILGPGRLKHAFVPHDQNMVVTTPFPLKDGRILCAAGPKIYHKRKDGRISKTNRIPTDLGIYWIDAESGELKPIYNNPEKAEFEIRPVIVRQPPRMPMGGPFTRMGGFTAKILCTNALLSQEKRVKERGCYIRIIEGQPLVTRHQSHTNKGKAWKNHTGTHARVLGTFPLAPDGSFFAEVPADRLIHCQILDSDRRVVGNQIMWMYGRPGEVKSCIGCHEKPDMAPQARRFTKASRMAPVQCLPFGGEFSYIAKYWNKGHLPDEGEERVRTIRAVNLLGRQ